MARIFRSVFFFIVIWRRNTAVSADKDLQARFEELEKKIVAENEKLQIAFSDCKERNTRLEDKINALENRLTFQERNELHNDLTNKRRQSPPETVAFTAYVSNEPQAHLADGQIISFDRTVTNIGQAFNVFSHTFTCPVTGLYLFSVVMSKMGPSEVVAKLVIDGVGIVEAISNPVQHANQQNDYHDQQGANIAVVEVRRGQSVYVVNYLHSDVVLRSDEIHRFTTFSGVLLHEM